MLSQQPSWGLGDYQNISSEFGNNSHNWSGDLFTGRIGIDALVNDGLMAGLSASISESEIEFDQENTDDVYSLFREQPH